MSKKSGNDRSILGQDQYKERAWWQPALTVFAEITGWIVVPIIVSLYLGWYLDDRYDSYPWFFLGLTAIAFVITAIGIVLVATKYIKQVEKEAQEKLTDQDGQNDNRTNR